MKRLAKSALLFVAVGMALYAGVYYGAEQLLLHTGRSNPFFKIATAQEKTFDWVILGASHAMPLDFSDFNTQMERETRLKILNLAATGAGPLYNRFVFEQFLRSHRARNLLYVVDSFAFYSRTWNEERFADPKLLRGTPFDVAIARGLCEYARREGVDGRAVLDYASGFSKINNRERFQRDVWEGEAQFERAYRPSSSAVKKRIDYLFPDKTSPATMARYLRALSSLVTLAREQGINVVVIKMPVPPQFYRQLSGEAGFDDALSHLVAELGVPFHDFSAKMSEPSLYFDTDHLNRSGLTEFFLHDLKPVLASGSG
jgi:hypothetical protein